MPDLDERLTRRLGATQRPVEAGPTFEALDRRRARRAARRRIERTSLAAGVAGAMIVAAVVAAGTFGSDRDRTPRTTATPATVDTPQPTLPEEPEGVDVGLDFRLCDVQRLGGIDFFGDGNRGVAWTGSPLKESGRCSRAYDAKHVVAVDHDGDGAADSWADLSQCSMCHPLAATDLGGDGSLELIVVLQASSTPNYAVYDVVPEGLPRAGGVYPILVEGPGAPEAQLPAGEQMTLWAGGDEGFSAAIRCLGYPQAPEIELAWSLYSISDYESGRTTTEEYHVTRLRLAEPDASSATFVVVETASTSQAIEVGLPFETPTRTCGVRWL
jgi:hypothetical protein